MAPQIGFHGLAPRSRAHLCFTMVEGSNRRREEGDVSRGFRVPRATVWQGPIGFFVASPFPIWRRTHFPSTLNSCQENRTGLFHFPPSFVCCEGPTKGSNCGASGRGASAVIGRTGLSALVAPGESRTPLPPSGRSEQIQGSWTRICKWGGRRRNDTGRGGRHGSGGWNRRR